MPKRQAHVGRIQDVSIQIKALEKRLLGDKPIPMPELAIIHGEIRRMKQEASVSERRAQ